MAASIPDPSDAPPAPRSWWARAILIGSVVAVVLILLGPLGTRLGVWSFQVGLLMLIPAGTLLAALGVFLTLIALFVSRKRGYTGDGGPLLTSLVVCAVILAFMGTQFAKGASVPAIHNISTDVVDPPQFNAVVALRGEGSNDLTYDADALAPQQAEFYPEVKTLTVPSAPADTLAQAVAALEAMGLEIVAVDEAAGTVEATDTTFWFGFKDDVVVRVRAAADGSLVDVRSVSRVGVSDLGANAARIVALLERLG